VTLNVEELMTRCVITVSPTATIQVARRVLHDSGVRHLPVVTEGKRLVGILSDRDLLATRRADSDHVAKLMTEAPQTVFLDTPAYEAAAVMLQQMFGCLPVVDSERRLLGLLTATDLLLEAHGLLSAESPSSDTSQGRAVQVEHAVLRGLLERVKAATYPDTAVVALADLKSFLVRHFAREEGGLFVRIGEEAPDLASDLLGLCEEHSAILDTVDLIKKDNRALADDGAVDVSTDVSALVATIERHEAKEAELMREVASRRPR
jgi:hypothetical protein